MTSTDVYRLAVPTGQVVFAFTALTLLSLFSGGVLVWMLATGQGGIYLPLFVFTCAAFAWNWYVLLGIPYEIRFHEPDELSFVSLRRATTLPIATLHSITPYRRGGGFYVLRHQGGKIRLFAQITGFQEALSRVKAANPNFRVVGI